MKLEVGERDPAESHEALMGLRHGALRGNWLGCLYLPFDWMQKAELAETLIGFVIGGLMIAIIGLSYGFTIRALPLTGGGVAFAMAALGRAHAFIAGWALTLGYSCVVALNASAVALIFRVTFPDLVM